MGEIFFGFNSERNFRTRFFGESKMKFKKYYGRETFARMPRNFEGELAKCRGEHLCRGFVPAAEPLLFRQKWPKPLTPRLALLEGRDAKCTKSGPTRRAQTRAARCEERPPLGPAGRRRNIGEEFMRNLHKRAMHRGMME